MPRNKGPYVCARGFWAGAIAIANTHHAPEYEQECDGSRGAGSNPSERTADNPTGRANSGNEDRNEGSDGCSRTEEVAHIVDASIVAPCNSSEIRR